MFVILESSQSNNEVDAARFLSMLVHRAMLDDVADVTTLLRHKLSLHQVIPEGYRDGVSITLYQPGNQRLRVVRQRKEFWDDLLDALTAVRGHPRFGEFDLVNQARVQFDFFGFVERDICIDDFSRSLSSSGSFEFGIDGLRIRTKTKDHYFMPGDCYVRSILGLGQLRRHLKRLTGLDRIADCPMDRLRSTSFVSYGDHWLPLYRGHPVPGNVTVRCVEQVCDRAIGHILANFRPDGRFMYYYDAGRDSHVDHEHPNRDPVTDPYYNELRHCGGIVTLLLAYRRRGDPAVLSRVEQALEFVERISHTYETSEGRVARHLIYNRKSKLGGAGLALYAISLYQELTGKKNYSGMANELAEHIISEIGPSGEFRYYYIYLDEFVEREENSKYFSFYYPGEALIGLAAYMKSMKVGKERFTQIESKIKAALRYLLVDRPRERASEYQSLPSDSWLMAAINELWDMPQFRDPSYARFVFDDADTMVSQMYTESNALFPDYVGAFYYNLGDFPYPDGARCEGLVAALALAEKTENHVKVERYASALVKATRATILLANSPESLYFASKPEKALGGIRFKLTRQWFRIDTIQHVVCYYYRFLDIYERLLENGVVLEDRFAKD